MTSRPQVIHLVNSLDRGGAEKQLRLIIGALRDQYQSRVVTLRAAGSQAGLFEDMGIAVDHLNLSSSPVSIQGLRAIRWVARQFRDEPPAILHTWLYHPNLMGAVASRFASNCRLVTSKRSSNCWYRRQHFLANRFVYRASDAIIVNATCLAEEILQYNDVRTALQFVPNAIDLAEIDRTVTAPSLNDLHASGATVIGSVGRFVPLKRHVDILQAFSQLTPECHSLHLVLVGGRGDVAVIRRMIDEMGIRSRVTLTGELDEPLPYVHGFDIYVSASTTEGCSNAIMEAMALGVPPVATNVGGTPELIRHGVTGILVTPEDVSSLRDGMQRLLSDESLRKRLGREARAAMQRHSVSRTTGLMDQIYKDVLSGESRAQPRDAGNGPTSGMISV